MKIQIKLNLLILLFLSASICAQESEIISEEYNLKNDSIQLPGTLSFKKMEDAQPLVIFIQGSGNPDRNGNQAALGINANYIKTLRDSLNHKGIAFYSYDKRNVTPSNMPLIMEKFEFTDLVDDAKIAISEFLNDERFSSITIIGHSQGSLVGMLATNNEVDKFISLAGVSETIDKTIVRQVTNQNAQFGQIAESHFKELKETGEIKEPNPMLQSIFAKQNLEFIRSYMAYDPVEEIKKLDLPVLIINGNKDLQVLESDAKALHEADPDAELKIIDGMNHVLKTISKDEDNMKSYMSPDFPISEELIAVITTFVKK
jgi:pimeloyl-ACP methyl ester carboxylesterase